MTLPPVIRDAIRLLFLAILEHQYVVLFGVVAIEEAGVPLPAPTDVVIAFFGYRARGDIPILITAPVARMEAAVYEMDIAQDSETDGHRVSSGRSGLGAGCWVLGAGC